MKKLDIKIQQCLVNFISAVFYPIESYVCLSCYCRVMFWGLMALVNKTRHLTPQAGQGQPWKRWTSYQIWSFIIFAQPHSPICIPPINSPPQIFVFISIFFIFSPLNIYHSLYVVVPSTYVYTLPYIYKFFLLVGVPSVTMWPPSVPLFSSYLLMLLLLHILLKILLVATPKLTIAKTFLFGSGCLIRLESIPNIADRDREMSQKEQVSLTGLVRGSTLTLAHSSPIK